MKHLFISMFVLAISHFAQAADPSLKLNLVVEGAHKTPGHTLVLKEKVAGSWVGSYGQCVVVQHGSGYVRVNVVVDVTKDGAGWSAQIRFADRVASGVAAADLTGIRLLGVGTQVKIAEGNVFEPRATVEFN